MAYVEDRPKGRPTFTDEARALAMEWRKLTRAATWVAVFTSPATFTFLTLRHDWPLGWALLVTFASVIAFRGLVDVLAHRFIPRASLYGAERPLLEEDVVARRRVWFWRTKWRRWTWIIGIAFVALVVVNIIHNAVSGPASLSDTISMLGTGAPLLLVQFLPYMFLFPLLFFFNFLILFGPLVFFGVKQMKGYEPGDADWGVKLEDVRGQAEPKEDVTRVISLWQSGEEFRAAGGKPERGLLFIGAPGTGKTMLSKAIATSFNSPIMMMPGSGFASTFMGMDVVIVLILIGRARRLARKWGGQCIIFIDEIDAVGMRRQALGGGGMAGMSAPPATGGIPSLHDWGFHGPMGALTPTGDLVLETRAWREKLFESRAEPRVDPLPPFWRTTSDRIQSFMMPGGMMGGGQLALNQLLVQMDGIDEPPFKKRFLTRRINTFLDATYVVPTRIGKLPLRLKPPKPRSEQIYFIGATNVPLDVLDPALIRPGRMGRHIWFRTPTKDDRVDIFDLYLGKVDHVPDLDTERRRDELARIAIGYSPAMIEQVCSMALTYAHSDGRMQFGWTDIVEAMTTIESGTAVRIEYVPAETRSTAIHEAGHAVASHVYCEGDLSTRLSIRKRGYSQGHHQAIEVEERFIHWRSESFARLIWTLGAMAAERVFYGENTDGVGGDVRSATATAAWMVGACGMAPEPVDLRGKVPASKLAEREEEIMERFNKIGAQILNRASSGSFMQGDPVAAVLADPGKRKAAAQIVGQAYLTAQCLVEANRDELEAIADELVMRREIYGDEVVELLDRQKLRKPQIDLTDPTIWPKL
ncbi:MAG: cell division protease FtsH [Solirubrobacteraceae bacterium]|jgi:ATP-dependent Zn protease|nr:cell division protease FtsH [Solirubrobacteraceae bacterium]